MNKLLDEIYGISIDFYESVEHGIVFFINDSWYYFYQTDFQESYIYQSYVFVSSLRIPFHEFIFTKRGKLSQDGYVLFRLKTLRTDVNLDDIYTFMIEIDGYDTLSMNDFWTQKLDYIEDKVLSNDNYCVLENFDYYLGTSELLLSLFRKQNFIGEKKYLCHRTFRDLSSISFYNPLNVTVDYRYRDIASYIFLCKDYLLLEKILKRRIMSSSLYYYFYIRLCFPFFYYSILLDYFDDKISLSEFEKVTKIDSYEDYLLQVSEIFSISLFSYIKKRN